MKSLFSILILALGMITYSNAQDVSTALEKMSKEDKAKLLALIYSENGKLDKQLKKAIKKLPKEELTEMMAKVNKPKPVATSKMDVFRDVEKAELPKTKIEFKEVEYDFGEVTEGEKVTYIYEFKNTGKKPLTITKAKGSCGCTVPKWPKEPIKPGKKGEIEVVFNTKNKRGKQTKVVTITANTEPANTVVRIKGNVKPAIKE